MNNEPILKVRNLTAKYVSRKSEVYALRNVSLEVFRGERVAVVGESGSGKTTLAMIITRLEPRNLVIEGEDVLVGGLNVLRAREKELRELRRRKVSVIFQNPSESLDPLYKVGDQVIEALKAAGITGRRKQLRVKAEELLRRVNLPDPERIFDSYPHELSGGQKQRVAIAIALAKNPKLLVADEPTTALDVSVQTKILELLTRINEELGVTEVLITHDIGIAYDFAQRIVVMYAGMLMEYGRARDVMYSPVHPYTAHLVSSVPKLYLSSKRPFPEVRLADGAPPDTYDGCPLTSRCPRAVAGLCDVKLPKQLRINGRVIACHNPLPSNLGGGAKVREPANVLSR